VNAVTSDLCARVIQAVFCMPSDDGLTVQEAALAAPPDGPGVNLFAKVGLAAKGDRETQSLLARFAIWEVLGERADDPFNVLAEGLMFARMAALQGSTDDEALVIAMLSLATGPAPAEEVPALIGEAIAWAEVIAERGGEIADKIAGLLTACADGETAETLQWAQHFRAQLIEAKGLN
jgi:hypothetical protein